MTKPFSLVLPALLLAAAPPSSAAPGPLDSLVRAHPADSLVLPLRRFETLHGRDRSGGQAALMLGQLHYARGEYRQAAEAFTRAAARLDPAQKHEARYWTGLSRLALREPAQARALLEEVAASASSRRAAAMLGVAQAWEMAQRPDRAYDVLEQLLKGDPGEAGPAALERLNVLATRLHRSEDGRKARERLTRQYPRSIEATRAATPETPPGGVAGTVAVHIGSFASVQRARTLERAARKAGFSEAKVIAVGDGTARSWVVRLGLYASAADARGAGEQAGKRLGVTYRLSEKP